MAGTLTHFYVMRKYFNDIKGIEVPFDLEDKKFKDKEFLATSFLGSTGPDIFYMKGDYGYISDFHHYKNVGLFVKNLYNRADKLSIALADGFLCHMATDLVIHPFVNSLVGKYQEHIIKSVEIPGPMLPGGLTQRLDGRFVAHNMVEFAQDYYVQTYKFKINTYWKRTGSMFTHPIKNKKDDISKLLHRAILKTYDITIPSTDISDILNFYCNKIQMADIQDHVDMVIEDEYKNYKIFLGHTNGSKTTFDTLIDKSVNLTMKLIKSAKAGRWDKIIKPLNLDTGLYTQALIDEDKNQININFNSFEKLFG